jgi:hypothetical protein
MLMTELRGGNVPDVSISYGATGDVLGCRG